MDLGRRETLSLGFAASLFAVLPAAAKALPLVEAPPLPAWVVGTDEAYNWQHVVAKSAKEAMHMVASENSGLDACACKAGEDDECKYCFALSCLNYQRVHAFDGKAKVTSGDWIRAGLGHICKRCGNETYPHEDGHAIGDDAVCEQCLTKAERAAIWPEDEDEA